MPTVDTAPMRVASEEAASAASSLIRGTPEATTRASANRACIAFRALSMACVTGVEPTADIASAGRAVRAHQCRPSRGALRLTHGPVKSKGEAAACAVRAFSKVPSGSSSKGRGETDTGRYRRERARCSSALSEASVKKARSSSVNSESR